MAKSFFEPKKIVRYANNQQLIEGGLGSAPAPRRAASATRPVPKTQAIPAEAQQVSAPAPAPTPPPAPAPAPAPPARQGETRAFSFDGATELTGSFSTQGGKKMAFFTIHGTFTPGWSQETTGSFTFFTVRNPSDNADIAWTYGFERVSGSNGYEDRVTSQFTSGSAMYSAYKKLLCSPNFYSGSTENLFLEITTGAGNLQIVRENGKSNTLPQHGSLSGQGSGKLSEASRTELSPSSHVISIGGHASGSSEYYSGSINNFSLAKGRQEFIGSAFPPTPEKNKHIDFVFKFEGTLANSKGNQILGVVGTETYVSSSI